MRDAGPTVVGAGKAPGTVGAELGPDTGAIRNLLSGGRVLARHQTPSLGALPDQTKRSAHIKGGDPARELPGSLQCFVHEDFVTAPTGPPDRAGWSIRLLVPGNGRQATGLRHRFSERLVQAHQIGVIPVFDGKTRGHMPDIARQFITYGSK